MMSKHKILSRALFAVLAGATAFGAQAAQDTGFYAGAGAGQSQIDEHAEKNAPATAHQTALFRKKSMPSCFPAHENAKYPANAAATPDSYTGDGLSP